jgi:nucleotide-binding universal stress UspA family protein
MSDYHIRKIVVPVDLSETSLNALETAVALARKHEASLYLLNVIENNFDLLQDEVLYSSSLVNSADVLSALAGAIQHANDIKPEVVQIEGNVTDTIVKFSLTHQSELIIMGTHGASGYRDGFMGSNTYSVMKHATCPVLSVPPKRKFLSFKKILFPIRPVSGALMRYDVVSHLHSGNSSMDVLGLSYRMMERDTNVLDRIVDEIKDKLIADKIKVNINWNKGNAIPDDILQFSQENNSDLIIVTSVLDVTTKPGFIGPHSQKIINCSRIPVLNIKKLAVPSWV